MPEAITVSITRTVKRGCEADFERALHDFVQNSLSLPGQQGVHIMRPAPGSDSREYGIIRKFANREALAAFRTSPEYLGWANLASELTEGTGKVEELNGLESWFTLRDAPLRRLPKWKMALLTFCGVYVLSFLLAETLTPLIHNLPVPIRTAIFSAVMVAALTWIVMPLITRALHGWLHSDTPGK
jgi:antibiotic biosynthesis monooxygenase (ABM) superfamily enzyme